MRGPRQKVLARTIRRDAPLIVLGVVVVFLAAEMFTALSHPEQVLVSIGGDYRMYMEAASRWLASGVWYLPTQLAGPYDVALGDVMYPPSSIPLFVPFAFLPAVLWWAIPTAIVAVSVWAHRPSVLAWALIGVCLAAPYTWFLYANGNPVIWAAAALALGTHRRWAAAGVLVKPSLFPFALFGVRSRGWWAALGAGLLLAAVFAPMWPDYVRAILNARGQRATVLYSVGDVPLMSLPLIAWLGRHKEAGAVTNFPPSGLLPSAKEHRSEVASRAGPLPALLVEEGDLGVEPGERPGGHDVEDGHGAVGVGHRPYPAARPDRRPVGEEDPR